MSGTKKLTPTHQSLFNVLNYIWSHPRLWCMMGQNQTRFLTAQLGLSFSFCDSGFEIQELFGSGCFVVQFSSRFRAGGSGCSVGPSSPPGCEGSGLRWFWSARWCLLSDGWLGAAWSSAPLRHRCLRLRPRLVAHWTLDRDKRQVVTGSGTCFRKVWVRLFLTLSTLIVDSWVKVNIFFFSKQRKETLLSFNQNLSIFFKIKLNILVSAKSSECRMWPLTSWVRNKTLTLFKFNIKHVNRHKELSSILMICLNHV